MAAIDQAVVQGYMDASAAAQTTTGQGRALEDLICYLFALVPGIAITRRNVMNVFHTEEIDVALWNDPSPEGFNFLPNIILVECKNWSNSVGSGEVNWFDSKLRNRGLDIGILVSTRGITGDPNDLTAAHAVVAAALRERRRLVVITVEEIVALGDTSELAHLLKEKLCDLAVRGAIG
ncbi:restriction endonuclease [Tianweitania sp.]|uniref:restriction endonuclease n=1 Tax=Tianweitania sp. TaxID=2021634 RepID=UPI00289DD585|nr:restriction endonuclease [Tianweitania sp.]